MAFPKLTAFDARSFAARLYERVRKPDGDPYPIFGPDQFPPFVQSLRALRDAAAATDVFAHDIKGDLIHLADTTDARLDNLNARVVALEELPNVRPFP